MLLVGAVCRWQVLMQLHTFFAWGCGKCGVAREEWVIDTTVQARTATLPCTQTSTAL